MTKTTPFLDLAGWHCRVFNGDWVHPTGGTTEVVEPATGDVLTVVGLANAHDVATAAQTAADAQRAWAATAPRERAAVFRRAAVLLETHLDELSLWIARETGALIAKGQLEVREAATQLNIAAGKPLNPQGLVLPSTEGRLSYARRVPHGVVGVISPFNFPLILTMRAVAPALAYGNAVIIKPDPQTPVSGGFIIARAFELAGLPKGLLQVLPGGAEAGEAICTDPNVAMIAFTGSTGVGRRIGELAGRLLKRVPLELGGKSSLVVLDDADLDLAASNVAWGAWLHQGQICMASGRILVHEEIAPEMIRRLVDKARHLPQGNPATEQVALGPLINAKQVQRVHGIVTDSVVAGAKLEAGGNYEQLFYRPTVLSGVKPGMRAFEEEIFGPVVNLTTFSSDDEAVQLANQTAYGLSAGVISRSVGRAMRLGERLNVGMLHINDQTIGDDCVNPFGGCGSSGNGSRIGGPADDEDFTQWQWITVQAEPNRYPF